MTFHIGAKPGEIAETVLLPGDPYRARWAAQTFLENPVLILPVNAPVEKPGAGADVAMVRLGPLHDF